MLTLKLPEMEFFNQENNTFFTIEQGELCLEHSLFSISKWEEKYKKPFLNDEFTPEEKRKTNEELLDYIRMMTVNTPPPLAYDRLTQADVDAITEYIENKHTATTFGKSKDESYNRKILTSEVIYAWLVALQIPFEVQYWNFDRLITLIRVINEENRPKKKVSPKEQMNKYSAMNKARREKYKSKG